jgi:hypothetical protein
MAVTMEPKYNLLMVSEQTYFDAVEGVQIRGQSPIA